MLQGNDCNISLTSLEGEAYLSLFVLTRKEKAMKKKVITYGVYGMMEYQTVIKMGKSSLKVNFSDGSINSFGQNPAKFTTKNFMIQHAIEHSYDFRRGLIQIINEHELDEEVQISHNPVAIEPEFGDDEVKAKVEDVVSGGTDGLEGTEVSDVTEGADAEVSDVTEGAESSATEVEFSTNDEAKQYLESQFGVQRSKLRTRADIEKAGMQYGVKIYFVSE